MSYYYPTPLFSTFHFWRDREEYEDKTKPVLINRSCRVLASVVNCEKDSVETDR